MVGGDYWPSGQKLAYSDGFVQHRDKNQDLVLQIWPPDLPGIFVIKLF